MEKEEKKVIIFGTMGAGKDTAADILLNNIPGSKKYNIGDTTRNIAVILNDFPKWEKNIDILKEFLMKKTIEFKDSIDLFCKEYDIERIKLNKEEMVKDLINLFKDYSLWKNGTRPLLQNIADVLRKYDKNSMNYYIAGKILNDKNEVSFPIVVGGRTPADFEFYKNYGFLTIGIDCNTETKKKRLTERDGIAQLNRLTHNTEVYVEDLVKKSDIIIDNNGTMEQLKTDIMEKLNKI